MDFGGQWASFSCGIFLELLLRCCSVQDQGYLFSQEAVGFFADGTEGQHSLQNSRLDHASGFIYGCSFLPSSEQIQFLIFQLIP